MIYSIIKLVIAIRKAQIIARELGTTLTSSILDDV